MEKSMLSVIPDVSEISISEQEEKMLSFWEKSEVFQNCLKQSKDKPRFTFYDGPPFATGLPHYGHILAGTIKDVVTRWAHQTGHHVERRFGWDTHGLPVEYEIDKTNNIKGPEDVEKMGIKAYNDLCRGIVTRYAKEWEQIVSRLGRFIDFKNDYKTMYPSFMESVWWVFSQLYEKGLVYRGVKVMPFSTACSTPLSNFEAGQNYKNTQDPSVVASFPLVDDPNTCLLAWTTTPWTLPSNLALCVNPEMVYVKLQGKTKDRSGIYIMMESRIIQVFKKEEDYEILSKFKGIELEGQAYVPLFPYFEKMTSCGAFKVLVDSYVTSESGTGVVHQAPYFGEDDFKVCLRYKIIKKDQDPICPVNDTGKFVSPVEDFKGLHVKEADKEIIKHLKGTGRLIQSERINHNYPYCWRSDTPLIYRAVPSWFVRVEHMQEKLLEANSQTYWVPNFVKEKRFANWLKDARDWAISRNRYWGTPIPLWVSDDMEEIVCIGSIEELQNLSGEKITDLHRDSIDHITIPSKRPGKPALKRISEVFDCWFESGSMPYAQVHYPFENKREFEDCFPADFIAEGIDQTRGWFYTLLVISTSLFGKPPFKNLIANGLLLASDGQKMSKSKKNYPDPMEVVNKYGADALRLYLMNSPAVRGENLAFRENDVFSLLKEVFIPWLNAYRFFVQQVHRLEKEEGVSFTYDEEAIGNSQNVMDKWILSFTQSLLSFVHKEMNAYRLYTVTPRLIKFVDNLTNWYVRFNRKRLKGESDRDECMNALHTLFTVLLSMVRIMSPFTPFIAETMYQNLKNVLPKSSKINMNSVHYLMVPSPIETLICPNIEASVSTLQSVVELGRYIRDKVTMPLKYPLPEIIVIHKDQSVLDDVLLLENYIKEELNVKNVIVSTDKEKYGVVLKAELNFKLLGSRLKSDMKKVQQKVAEFKDADFEKLMDTGYVELFGHIIKREELSTRYKFGESSCNSSYEAHSDASVLILLDTTPSQEMLDEGLAREITNRIQKLRKSAKLLPTDDATVWLSVAPDTSNLVKVVSDYHSYIENSTKTPVMDLKNLDSSKSVLLSTEAKIGEAVLKLALTKDDAVKCNPICPWVNVVYTDTNGSSKEATLLLENPVGIKTVDSVDKFLKVACSLLGCSSRAKLYLDGKLCNDLEALDKRTAFISCDKKIAQPSSSPVRFVNIENSKRKATVLLENPKGVELGAAGVKRAVKYLLEIESQSIKLYTDNSRKTILNITDENLSQLPSATTLYA